MNLSPGSTGLLHAVAAPMIKVTIKNFFIATSRTFPQKHAQESETCARKRLAFPPARAYFYLPENVPKPRRVSIGRRGVYIATSKEEPQR